MTPSKRSTTASKASSQQQIAGKTVSTKLSPPSPSQPIDSLSEQSQKGNGLSDQARQALAAAAYFCSGAIAINTSQLLATPLSHVNKAWYDRWMTLTKGTFGLLTTTTTQLFAPTVIRLSGDASMRGQLLTDLVPSSTQPTSSSPSFPSSSSNAILAFPSRLILMANHQTYTDWLYLWWAAYAAGHHDAVHIVLKDSLRHLPFVGWGMALSRFIFLKREWKHDKVVLAEHMARLSGDTPSPNPSPNTKTKTKPHPTKKDPMWLLLFPEGTNLASCTRARSAAYAHKAGLRDMQHVLLPRATGLRFILSELRRRRDSGVDWLYDATIAYDGVKRGEYAQDVYPFPASYLAGLGTGMDTGADTGSIAKQVPRSAPRAVSIHFRRFRISEIPGLNSTSTTPDDAEDHTAVLAFTSWLLARWREKDALFEHWYTHDGRFPADRGVEVDPSTGEFRRGAGVLEVPVRAKGWREFLRVCAPMGILGLLVLLGVVLAVPAVPRGVLDGLMGAVMAGWASGGAGDGGSAGKEGQAVEMASGGDTMARGGRTEKEKNVNARKTLLAFDGSAFVPVDGSRNITNKGASGDSGIAKAKPEVVPNRLSKTQASLAQATVQKQKSTQTQAQIRTHQQASSRVQNQATNQRQSRSQQAKPKLQSLAKLAPQATSTKQTDQAPKKKQNSTPSLKLNNTAKAKDEGNDREKQAPSLLGYKNGQYSHVPDDSSSRNGTVKAKTDGSGSVVGRTTSSVKKLPARDKGSVVAATTASRAGR